MDAITQFWNWFKDNNKRYVFPNSVDPVTKEKVLDDFLEQLHKYCDKIYFEIGGYPDEDQELIVTAEGNKEYFDKVEELIGGAPKIEGWIFIALKQPMPGHFKSKWGDIELNTEEMWFAPLSSEDPNDLGIRVYLRNYDLIKDSEHLMSILFKMFDTILGEKSFAVDIDHVDTDLQPNEPEEEGLYPILDLPNYINWHKAQRKSTSERSAFRKRNGP
jgi:hypothetical protein